MTRSFLFSMWSTWRAEKETSSVPQVLSQARDGAVFIVFSLLANSARNIAETWNDWINCDFNIVKRIRRAPHDVSSLICCLPLPSLYMVALYHTNLRSAVSAISEHVIKLGMSGPYIEPVILGALRARPRIVLDMSSLGHWTPFLEAVAWRQLLPCLFPREVL